MAINNITQTISTIPEAAHRGVDVQTQFVIKQEDFQDHLQGTTVDELNTLKDQLNSRIGEINSTTTTMNGYANTASAGASTATTKAGEASTSAGEALAYRNQAETFKNNASASATKASQWADNNYNVEVETGKYSAKHWSTVAQNATANKVDKVTSTDNAVVRFDGTTGQVQNSGVVIDDSGNVGIGVTPSSVSKLQVKTGINRNISITDQVTVSGAATIEAIDDARGSNIPLELRGTTVSITRPSGTTCIFDSAGNVGIGVTPSASGNSTHGIQTDYNYIGSQGGSGQTMYNAVPSGAASSKYVQSSLVALAYEQNSSGQHIWKSAPSGTAGNAITWTNAMTLDASGNLLLGLSGGTGVIQAASVIYSWNNASNHTYINNQTVSGVAQVFGATVGGALKAAIYANGNFGSATSVYGGVSDIKLKENVVDATPKLEKLMQVQVRNFNFIGQEDKQIGVIAQEIEQIFPSLIFETKDTKQVEVTKTRDITDEEGNVTQEEYTEIETQETGEVTKNVKYSIIYMMMLKGLQEMRAEYTAEINDLKARIEILEGAK